MQQKKKVASITCAVLLAIAMLSVPSVSRAQSQGDDGAYHIGALLFSIVRFPFKLVNCVGTQVITGAAYIATFGVEGNYEGGTNGKQIGEVARAVCTSPWIITGEDVKRDYQ